MIFQSYAIWPNMTLGENVACGLQLRKISREEVRNRVKADLLPGSPVANGSIALSIRPHGVRLHRDSTATGPLAFTGTVIGSAYLGDRWTYQIVPSGSASGTPMRVNTAPYDRFELGETVSLAIDPRAVAVVTR